MSERLKAFIYIRVKDDTHQTDWLLDDKPQSGTIAIAVPEFSEAWKAAADDRYASEFGLGHSEMDGKTEEELVTMQTAREMLLEQDYQFAAEIENLEIEADSFYEVTSLDQQPDQPQWKDGVRFLTDSPQPSDTIIPHNWEGAFRIIKAKKTPREMLDEAVAQGKTVLCAVPLPIGAKYFVIGPDGAFAGAYEITLGAVKPFEKAPAYHLFAELRALFDREADTAELKSVMGTL